MPYRICFVCMGNICRSPTAEVVMRSMLAEAGLADAVVVDSAGTGSWHAGESADERARESLAARGYDGDGHVARQFDPAWFAERDLIVAMDGKNLQALRWLAPDGQEGKLVRLRSFDRGSRGGDLDVPDPYYGGPDGFDEVITLIEAGCAGLLDHVRTQVLRPTTVGQLEQLRRSFVAVDLLISRIRPEQWSASSPCDEWDVRRVADHLVGLNRVFAAMLADEAPIQHGEDLTGEELPQAFRASAARLMEAFSRPGALNRSYTGPLGTATGSDRLRIRLYDLLAHGWDLAVATGQLARLPEDAVQDSLTFVRGQLSDDARRGRFGAPQQVAADATALEQLVAFLGRRPAWPDAARQVSEQS